MLEMKNYAILLLIVLTVFACKKDDAVIVEPPAPAPLSVYIPMEVGNYWVYQNFKVENTGETPMDQFDSIAITRDTIIRDHRYFIFEGINNQIPSSMMRILRDSSGYYVYSDGRIYFSDQINNKEVYFEHISTAQEITDTVWYLKQYNEEVENQISFPIGSYKVRNKISDFTIFPQEPNFADTLKYRKANNYFIEDIGQASYSIFYAQANFHYDKRLVRYQIVTMIED